MAGMKIVHVFAQSIVNRVNIFYCLKELLCRHLVLLHHLTVALILFFSFKKWHKIIDLLFFTTLERDFPLQHHNFLNQIQKLNYNTEHFLLPTKNLNGEWMLYVSSSGKFSPSLNLSVIITIKSNDLYMFAEFLSMSLTKVFVDPKSMFRKICRQHPFEFLIMFDLCPE